MRLLETTLCSLIGCLATSSAFATCDVTVPGDGGEKAGTCKGDPPVYRPVPVYIDCYFDYVNSNNRANYACQASPELSAAGVRYSWTTNSGLASVTESGWLSYRYQEVVCGRFSNGFVTLTMTAVHSASNSSGTDSIRLWCGPEYQTGILP